MNKKNVLLVTLVALVIFILLGVGEAKLHFNCSYKGNERIDGTWEPVPVGTPGRSPDGNIWVTKVFSENREWCEPIAIALIPFILLIPFSLLTYKMRDEVFRSWLHFAYWWVPLSMALTLLAGRGSGGGFGMPNVLDQGFFAFIFAALFTIISLVIITWKYFATRGGRDRV